MKLNLEKRKMQAILYHGYLYGEGEGNVEGQRMKNIYLYDIML